MVASRSANVPSWLTSRSGEPAGLASVAGARPPHSFIFRSF
jgi:hypothetical protein